MPKKPKDPQKPEFVSAEEKTPVEPVERWQTEDPTSPVILIDRMRERYSTDMEFRDEMNAMRERWEKDLAFRGLYNMFRRQRRESGGTLEKIASASLEAHADSVQRQADMAKIGELVQWKTETDTVLKLAKWILGFVIAATLGSIVVVVTKIYAWGESSGALEDRITHVEQSLTHMSREK